jgi:sugar phosphate isomerase/epimerase
MPKLSAFADEVATDFLEQVKFLNSENISYIEIRFVNGNNILNLSKAELSKTKKILDDQGIKVSAIGSPIGKIKLDDPFEPHLDKFKHSVELAGFFDTQLIRIFSYYPPENKNIDDYRDEVLERMRTKLEVMRGSNAILVHENEEGIYGYSAKNCLDMAETLDSPQFRLVYDPANFVWHEQIANGVEVRWPLMKPYVNHVHIKDWKIGPHKVGSIPGEGDGQMKELFSELAKDKYDGFLTMEPHLEVGGQFGGHTGPKLYSQAIKATRKLGAEAGLQIT